MPNHAMLLRLDLLTTRTTIRISSPKTSQEKTHLQCGPSLLYRQLPGTQPRQLQNCLPNMVQLLLLALLHADITWTASPTAQDLIYLHFTTTTTSKDINKPAGNCVTPKHTATRLPPCKVTIAQQHSKLRRCETASMQSSNASSCLSYKLTQLLRVIALRSRHLKCIYAV